MHRGYKVGVVVPAFNEEALIGKVIETMPDYVDRIFIVDDCSTDATVKKLLDYKDLRIVLLRHSSNRGVGAAIVTGYKQAKRQNMDLIAVMAGDNQMNPSELLNLLDPLIDGVADYSKGDRLSRSELTVGMSRWRRFGNNLLAFLTRISSGYWALQDPQNGYTAITRQALEKIDLAKVYPGYGYCNDLLVKLNVMDMKVLDVPIPARYGEEKSKIRYTSYIRKVSFLLLKNFLWRVYSRYQHPRLKILGVTYPAAFALCLIGFIILLASFTANLQFHLGALTFASGLVMLFLSVTFEVLKQNEQCNERGC